MMKAITSAKINLYLDVIRRREDGYHDIETLYQPVSLYDELLCEAVPSGIELSGDDPSIPWTEDNLCHQAARLVLETTGRTEGVRIRVKKGIPPGAGLGGGSSDAAATLLAVDRLYACGLSRARLLELAGRLGSDVPFFILGSPAIGRGRGEILEEAEGLPGGSVLIVKPDITVSTKWAYEHASLVLTRESSTGTLITLLSGLQGFPKIRVETYNAFEAGVCERFPSIAGILSRLRNARPVLCSLSGSGSACFAVFATEREAREVGTGFDSEGLFTRVVHPVQNAIRFV